MEFRILGPLEVTDGPRAISIAASKQRALLGLLLLHANEVVSSDRLIDELWGERPPATATKVVQTYVSQLRRALGTDRIATRPPGYVLRTEEEDELDVARFRRLVVEARRSAGSGERREALVVYQKALDLWRGPPLADVAFESFARNEIERLDDERLDAITARIDGELEFGLHDQLVTELETLVAEYPLRERFRGQLMLALYRSGRQADALAAYQEARRNLADELGLEPGRELHDLERAILTHDAVLELPEPVESGTERPPTTSGRRLRRPGFLAAGVVLLTVALGAAFVLDRGQPASLRLAPNSVGFIDAKSGRVTKSFRVGRPPHSLVVADDAVWVANYGDGTVTRIDRTAGPTAWLPVGGHPTGLAAARDKIWVWTLEGLLVPIDPRFNTVGNPVRLGRTGGTVRAPGRIAVGGGFLWLTSPPTTVIRVNPANPNRSLPIVPDDGAGGPIAYRNGKVWVAGYGHLTPISGPAATPGSGILVGATRGLTFSADGLWVVGGDPVAQGIAKKLRRIDVHGEVVEQTIRAGEDPVAVAAAGGAIWVADRSGRSVDRVDPAQNRVVETIELGAAPGALAADGDGIWVAVE